MYQECVEQFHIRNNYPTKRRIGDDAHKSAARVYRWSNIKLALIGKFVKWVCKSNQSFANKAQAKGDPRLYRCLLHLEEAGEISEALSRQDEVDLADGLGDLLYVVFGTADCYSLPMDPIFTEIHTANMSKKIRTEDNQRMRDKGLWCPPNIERVLKAERTKECL